jgi:phosphoesterase RecJ-like protein
VSEDLSRIRRLIDKRDSILVVSHVRPDGDAVGSLLASYLALQAAGHQVQAVLAEGVPRSFRFLPGALEVKHAPEGQADLLLALDCADADRVGLSERDRARIDINIDHHPTNTRYAQVNLVDVEAASTTQVLYRLFTDIGLPLTSEVATNLLAGLVTDTIGFSTTNVTPEVLRMAAALCELGAPLSQIYAQSLKHKSLSAVRYWGRGLGRLQREDGLVWTSLQLEDREEVGYEGSDDADLVNLMRDIEGTEIAVVFVEQSGGKIKISWRSREGLDVAALATRFGGGGHAPAAGAMVSGSMDEVRSQVLAATRNVLNKTAEPER